MRRYRNVTRISVLVLMVFLVYLNLYEKKAGQLGAEQEIKESVVLSALNRVLADENKPMLFRGDFEPGFSLELALKDLRLAVDLARELGVPMEMGALSEQRHLEAVARGWGQKSADAVVMLQEERTGVQLRLT